MQFVALGDLNGCAENLCHAISKRLAGITAISQNIFDIREVILVAIKGLQRAFTIGNISSCYVESVRQAVGVHADMTLDAVDSLPPSNPLFSAVSVFLTLCASTIRKVVVV